MKWEDIPDGHIVEYHRGGKRMWILYKAPKPEKSFEIERYDVDNKRWKPVTYFLHSGSLAGECVDHGPVADETKELWGIV